MHSVLSSFLTRVLNGEHPLTWLARVTAESVALNVLDTEASDGTRACHDARRGQLLLTMTAGVARKTVTGVACNLRGGGGN